jgi:hypothetical protein
MKMFNGIFFKLYCFFKFLQMWKSILYEDASYYRGKTEFLTAREAFEIAWLVWMRDENRPNLKHAWRNAGAAPIHCMKPVSVLKAAGQLQICPHSVSMQGHGLS